MDGKVKQCAAISFCIRLKYTIVHTAELLKEAYKEETLDEITILKWHKWHM